EVLHSYGDIVETAVYFENPWECWAYSNQGYWQLSSRSWCSGARARTSALVIWRYTGPAVRIEAKPLGPCHRKRVQLADRCTIARSKIRDSQNDSQKSCGLRRSMANVSRLSTAGNELILEASLTFVNHPGYHVGGARCRARRSSAGQGRAHCAVIT